MTSSTWAPWRAFARVASTPAFRVASCRVDVSGAAKTICAVAPDAAGKRCSRRSMACWDCVPGTVNWVDSGFEKATDSAVTATRIKSQVIRVSQRCR